MPGGVQIFAKALGMTELEMFKLIEDGKLMATDVLPKVAIQMKKMANEGGALEAKLQSTRVAQGQFNTALQEAQDKIFNSGFNKGLAGLFQTMTKSMNDNGITLERIGRIYEKVFNVISKLVQGATVFIEAFVRSLESLWIVMKWGIDNPIAGMLIAIPILTAGFKTLAGTIALAMRTPLVILTAVVGVMDEIRGFFDENVEGIFDDPNWTPEQRKKVHEDRRAWFTDNPLTRFGKQIGSNTHNVVQAMEARTGKPANWFDKTLATVAGYGITKWDMNMNDPTSLMYAARMREKQAANVTFNIQSTDPQQAATESWNLFSNFFADEKPASR